MYSSKEKRTTLELVFKIVGEQWGLCLWSPVFLRTMLPADKPWFKKVSITTQNAKAVYSNSLVGLADKRCVLSLSTRSTQTPFGHFLLSLPI